MRPGFLQGRRLGSNGASGAGPTRVLREEDEMEELLYQQAEFERKREQPAATCLRAPPRDTSKKVCSDESGKASEKLGASEDGTAEDMPARKRPVSLFKQLRQRTGTDRPFGAPAAKPHPELTALPELEQEQLSCLADKVAERTSNNSSSGTVGVPADPALAPPSGFPVPMHRAVGKNLGRHIPDRQHICEGAENEDPGDEEAAIHRENLNTLSKATPEEIQEWQQQLLQQFGNDTCEFLRRRGQSKIQKDAPKPTPQAEVETTEAAVGCTLTAAKPCIPTAVTLQLHAAERAEDELGHTLAPTSTGGGAAAVAALSALGGGCLDRVELQKLQWTMPVGEPDVEAVVADSSLPPEPAGKVIQLLRFDFEGRICLRTTGAADEECASDVSPDTSEGLHHHGAESSQAGYTLAELLLLTRSSNAPQRALAFRTLARVIENSRMMLERGDLCGDPAIKIAGNLDEGLVPYQIPRAGFGMGMAVFFWHGIARGDVAKHIVEGLGDTSQIVQLGALCSTIALLDGIVPSTVNDTANSRNDSGVIRGKPAPSTQTTAVALDERILGAPFDAARELVWPSAPPPCSRPLARRALVAVLAGSGGTGGGQAGWPQLLRRRLLGAPEEAEVTAADVLEPLLPVDDERSSQDSAAGLRLLLGIHSFLRMAGGDEKLLALAARALTGACSWSAGLCQQVLDRSVTFRQRWLQVLGEATRGDKAGQHRLELFRFMRRSCEVGGQASCEWWLATGDSSTAASSTARTAVLRAVLDVIGEVNTIRQCSDITLFSAVEGLYTWLAWLNFSVGVDAIDSFAASMGTYWHYLAHDNYEGRDSSQQQTSLSPIADCHWLIAALLLRLTCNAAVAAGLVSSESSTQRTIPCLGEGTSSSGEACLMAALDAAGPLAASLVHGTGQQGPHQLLCLSALAELLQAALGAEAIETRRRCEGAAAVVLSAKHLQGLPPVPPIAAHEGPTNDDEEAPWPVGGAATGSRAQRLARLRALHALCKLAARRGDPSAVPWLHSVVDTTITVVVRLGPVIPVDAFSEALVGPAQRDPWAALLAEACHALAACGAARPLDGPLLGRTLALASCLPTACAVLRSMGVVLQEAARDAVARGAFRPGAPWSPVGSDLVSRRARATGRSPMPLDLLGPPLALGPAALSFVAAPFWALIASPPAEAALALLELVILPSVAEAVLAVAPPWLPFVAFAALLSTPLVASTDDKTWAWANADIRKSLYCFMTVYLQPNDPVPWLRSRADWLGEALRGLCDRLATAFVEESFGDALMAKTLWAFAAPDMPTECREVCWGMQDTAVLVLLSRALPAPEELVWPLATYLSPHEEKETVAHAAATLNLAVDWAPSRGPGSGNSAPSWPVQLLWHHLSQEHGQPSPLLQQLVGCRPGSLDELE